MALSLETLRGSKVVSIHGRDLALDKDKYLVGPPALKFPIEDITTTIETTLLAYGLARISGLLSSQGPTQHNLPAPVPGVEKTIVLNATSTGSQQFLSTPNGASIFASSLGTTANCVNMLGPGGAIVLVGLTTAIWGVKSRDQIASTALAQSVAFTTST